MRAFGVLLLVFAGVLFAQGEPGPVFQVEFSNPQLVPSQWTLEFHRDGSGHFQSHRGGAARMDGPTIEAPDVDRDVRLSPQFAARAFQVAERKRLFHNGCESHLKVAFQGVKKLTYSGPEGQGSCEFNYSRDQDIQSLGDSLVAVANTLIEGARLQSLWQHDPLGLDKEMDVLQDSAGDGRAMQIGCIHDILQTLADDPAVMDRVRRKARTLLAKAND
jgi:hypothetical protein